MKNILIIASMISIFVSCQKVVNIDVKNAIPEFVIEGNVSNLPNDAVIKISKTENFSAPNSFKGYTGATVTLADDIGNIDTCYETSTGIYEPKTYNGIPGRTYTLTVQAEGKEFVAQSTMAKITTIDTIFSVPSIFGGKSNNVIFPIYKDEAIVKNYYRFIQYINNKEQRGVYYNDDQYSDGIYTQIPIFNGEQDVLVGDTVRIDLLGITEANYKYWFALDQNEQATPANPNTNISNGAFGYFSAHSRSSRSIIVPQ